MIGKKFKHNGETWTVVGENKDGYSCVCTNGKERGAFRFTFEEVKKFLETVKCK